MLGKGRRSIKTGPGDVWLTRGGVLCSPAGNRPVATRKEASTSLARQCQSPFSSTTGFVLPHTQPEAAQPGNPPSILDYTVVDASDCASRIVN